MNALTKMLLAATLLVSTSVFARTSVCYQNRGAYVANVKFQIIDLETNTVIKTEEKRRMWENEMHCIGAPTEHEIKVRVEHYMFLGNATLRHTCTRTFSDDFSHLLVSTGTTTNYRCYDQGI